jgi:uncharacterized repeat protein (TIGR01451 family)
MRWNLVKRRRGAPLPVAAESRCRPRDVSLHLERLEERIAPAVITPFTVRFAANTTGDTAIIGNTLETASTVGNPGRTQQDVTNAQNGTGSFVNDNDWNMAYVDMDGNSSTFDSSQASLNLPNGSAVLFAGLYWMGNSSSAQRNRVMFSTPASGGYTTLTGKVIGDSSSVSPAPSPSGPNYEGFVDVTSLVQAGGNGAYTVANVQATIGTNYYGGWSMIVAYRAPGLPARNITVFDGYGVIQSSDPALNIPISGFIAPPAGTVNAKVSVIAAEGDLGITGDSLKMNGTTLSNALNPTDNFFNSTISNVGTPFTAKTPNYTNQLGFDADSVQVPAGAIANSATSATVTLTTNGDTYFPGAVATTIDLYAPKLDAVKTVTDLSGGNNLPGDTLEYVVSVTNNGQDPAGNVVLTDPIPANTTYVAGSLRIVSGANAGTKTDAAGDDQARFDGANNQVVFDLGAGATATAGGSLAIGATTSISFDVKVNTNVAANTVIVNQATLNYTGVTTGFAFTSLSSAPGFTVTNSFADIAVTKTVSNATPNVGDAISFTVMATNNGPGPASGVNVVDLLPSGLQLTNATTTQGVYTGANGLWTIGSLANGGSAVLTIFTKVIGSTTQTNFATLSHTDSIDSISANNKASAALTPLLADLSVTKTVDSARPNVGDTVTFLITVTGIGPDAATNVQLTDLLPGGLSFVSSTPSTGSYNSKSGVWIVGTIANGGSATLQLKAHVVATGAQVNTASVTHSDVFDPNTGNNSAGATVRPQQADLHISKTVSNANPNVGDTINFTVTLTNQGPDAATGVTVHDLLPAGLEFVSELPSEGTYDSVSGTWTVGAVDTSAPRTLTLTVRVVSPAPQTNTATIAHSDQIDTDGADNTASATETPQRADLVVAKSVDAARPNVGDTITFLVTVTDAGPDAATGVQLTDLLPAGLILLFKTPSQGTYDATTGLWSVGTLASGGSATLQLQAMVVSAAAQTNMATISHSDQFDPNTGNNTASATETPQQADLLIIKSVSDPKPHKGDTVTYTLRVANTGPDTATHVAVNDVLPDGVTFVTSGATQGAYDNVTGIWTVGSIASAATATLTIAVTVDKTNAIVNTASVAGDQFDPDPANNIDSSPVKAKETDLLLLKSVSNPTPNVGDQITFTVTLLNSGPDTAEGVQVTDHLPTGLNFVSDTPSQGTYDDVTGLWDVGTVAPGPSLTLAIVATVASPAALTNTATITGGDRDDPNTANNSASATEFPQTVDLTLTKIVSDATPNVGDTITFTITLANLGPNDATGVVLTDLLPAGLSFVSNTQSQGSYNPANGLWSVGTVAQGAPPATLTLSARVDSPLPQRNTASVTRADQFDPNPANNSASASETPQRADLALTKSVSDPTPNVGDQITFTVTLSNAGPNTATGVIVSDLLLAGLEFVSAVESTGSYDSGTGLWTVGTVTTTTSQTLTIVATVVSASARTNTATISDVDQFDPITANNSATATETPQQADLILTKSVSNAAPNVGEQITFTITLTNNGPSNASGIQATDLLPTGLTLVMDDPSQGTYTAGTGIWDVGAVANGGSATLTLTATVDSPDALTNTAAVTDRDQFDPNTGNDSASATETPQRADLVITKGVSNSTPNLGDTITYTLFVANSGPDTATGVLVTDLLPAGVTFVLAAASQGAYDDDTGIWTVGTVAAAATPTLNITVTVDATDQVVNTATIDGDQFDPNLGNNTSSTSTDPQAADLALVKTVNDPTPNVGEQINFHVTLTNAGPHEATGVQVTDLLPGGVSFVSATPSQGTYDDVSGLWDVGTVTTATPQTLDIVATVVSSTAQTNTATVSDADQFDPNTGNDSDTATETPQHADLALTKSVSDPTPNVGDTITFMVTLSNGGPDAATGVQVTDLLPAGVDFVSADPSQGTYDEVSGLWDVGTVTTVTPQTLEIVATVVSAAAQTNTATVSDADQFDPIDANNSASATETPQQADLVLTKTVDNPTPNVGDVITFTVTITNNGPDTATGVQVTDELPPGLTPVLFLIRRGTFAAQVWDVGTLESGASATLLIHARVDSPSAQTNTATVTAAHQFDPNPTNNTADSTETPQQADLALAKAVSNATPNVGDTITFIVTLTNIGPDAATGVTINDLLPAGLDFVSATPSVGAYDEFLGQWFVGTIAGNATATLTISALVVSETAQTNTAAVGTADQFDPNTANDSASVTETPQQADLAVTKVVSNATPNVGDTITFTITVANTGPNAATGVTVTDPLPAGVSFVSDNPSQGAYDDLTGVWTVGTVAPGATPTLTITATVNSPSQIVNTATIDGDQFDPNPSNNTVSTTADPQSAELALAKSVSDATPNVSDQITFTVTLTNTGPNTATGVQVTDLLPAGVTFVSATPSQGTYTPGGGIWTVGTVTTGTPQTLSIVVTVDSAAAQTNTATIADADQFDPIDANNSASATETPQQADLSVSKTVDNPTPNVGDTINFTVTLSNSGPDAATNVELTDLLPTGLTLVLPTPSQGTYDPATGVWTVGDVATTAAPTLILTARVDSPSPLTNTATISDSDQFDADTGNDTAGVTETPQQSDLAITKTVSDPTPNVGDTITFIVTLTNLGPDIATNVQVTDLLPVGLNLVSDIPSQGSYDRSTGLWSVGMVGTSLAPTLTLVATVAAPGTLTNSATILNADQFDPDSGNNQASANETPQQADLKVQKTVDDAHPNVGDVITYTVTLTNAGPDDATNVQVTDLVPGGLSFVGATPSEGTYDQFTGLWDLGTLTNGSVGTLQIQARVDSPAAQLNTAVITGADQFDPVPGDNQGAAEETPQQADLAVSKLVSNPIPNVGDTITYTVHLTNSGPDDATGVTVLDVLPLGVAYQFSSATTGAFDPATRIWTLGSVAAGATQTLTITAIVIGANPQANTATIGSADQFDPDSANNSDATSIDPLAANLALAKRVSDPRPNVGDTITFTVTLSNNGPNSATNVQVTDLLPAGLTFVDDVPSQGTYDSATGVWTVGTVTTAAPQTLIIEAVVDGPGAAINTASITAADQFDPDPGNNTASAVEIPQQADLSVTKTVSDATPNVGDTITFTVTLTNNGPDSATNVQVTDLLPAGLTFVDDVPSQGTYDSVTGVWSVGTVDPAFARTLVIHALVDGSGPATNTATISDSDQFDPNAANDTASVTETPQQADVAITKTVNNPTPNVNDVVIFTVTVTNSGPDPATDVLVTDLLPAGLSLLLATPSQGAYSGANGLWTVGQVGIASPATLTLEARVASQAPVTNVATITHSDQFDPQSGNNTSSATETPQQADLRITKTVSDATPNVGDIITFVVTVTNNGPDTATHVAVLDKLPTGLGPISVVPSQGVYDPFRAIWSVGALAPGDSQTLTVTAEVLGPQARTNTATVGHSDQFDPQTGNNQASATETPQQSDLQVSKTVSNPRPNVNDTITFTVTLTNAGPDAATGVAVHDLLPAGLAFVDGVPSQGTYDSVTGVWTVGTVTAAASQTLTITATVAGAGAQTNTASISAADQFDPQTGNNTSSATETPQQADLQISKTVDNPTPNVGDTITYTITLTNNGPDTATNVTVQDILPPELIFSSIRGMGDYNPVTGIWTVGDVPAGTSQTLVLTAEVITPSPRANTATVDHSDQFDPNPANNSDTASVNPLEANLALSKTVSDATPNVGDTITFTVTLTDNGPADATGVEVTDLLPAGLTFVSDAPSQGTYDTVTGIWVVGTLANGVQATLTLIARVDSPAALTNTATVSAADQFDPNSGNDSAFATETPQQADLALTKTVDNATPNVGDTITFTVTLTNAGPDAATGVAVHDMLPAGLMFVSFTASQGTYDNTTGVWTLGTVTAAAPQTLTIQAVVAGPGAETNKALISAVDQFDPDAGNNSASAIETPQQADLQVRKTVSDATPNVGDTITFTVVVTNVGPDAATNVRLTDLLPNNLTFVSDAPSQGTYDSATGVWDVGTLAGGGSAVLTLTAHVASASAGTNTATITHADQFDPVPADNSSAAAVTPQQSDLSVTKTVSDARPNVGDTITFTVTLTNNGPDPATGVTVEDVLPAGLTFLTAIPSQGVYADGTGIWVVGTIVPGAPQTLQIEVRVDSPDAQTNTATISQADQFDPQTGNDEASATETPQQSDLQLTKTVSNPTPNVGDTISFTVTLTNSGPDPATGVAVQELLPSGLTFVSAIPTQGTYDNTTGVWTVGAVTVGAPASLVIQARVNSPIPRTNQALISGVDQFDPNTGNNQATVTETPQRADLALSKTVSNARPNVGDTISFTVTLTNSGPDAATNVRVNDLLPPGLTFIFAAPSQGTYDNTAGVWAVGAVPTAATQTLTIQARVDSPDSQTNTASVGHADQFDPQTANNQAGVAETPQQADLALTKTVSNSHPNVGDTIIFTVTLTNSGPDSAAGVIVNDLLPAGLTFVAATPSQGSYNSATGVWSVNTLAPLATATLQIQATVVSGDAQTNTAVIGAADQFDANPGDNQAGATETPQRADLALTKVISGGSPNLGDIIIYTITLTNNGPDQATGVVVADVLSPELSFVSAAPSQGTYDPATGLWTVGTVAPSAVQTLQIQARVVGTGSLTNTASIRHSDQFDSEAADNSASASPTPQTADLAVVKTAGPGPFTVGQQITYTLTVTNQGPATDTNVVLVDQLPAGVTFITASIAPVSQSAGSLTFQLGTLGVGQLATVIVIVRADVAGTLVNQAMVSGALPDLVSANDVSSVASAVAQAAPTVVALVRFGFHEQPTLLVLAFSEPLDPARAQDLGNYRLIVIAHGGRLHHPVQLSSAVYDAATHTVTLHPTRLLPLRFKYMLTVNGTTPTGVTGTSGLLLDGDDNGQPGGNYVRTFGRGIVAGPNRPASVREHGIVRTSPPAPTRPVHFSRARVTHSAAGGPGHVHASAPKHSGGGLHPSAVDAVHEAASSRLGRK